MISIHHRFENLTRFYCCSSSSSPSTSTQLGAADQGIISSGAGHVATNGSRIVTLGGGSRAKASKSVPAARREDEAAAGEASALTAYAEAGAVQAGGSINTGLQLGPVTGNVTIGEAGGGGGGLAGLAGQITGNSDSGNSKLPLYLGVGAAVLAGLYLLKTK